jgi:hypothetical protein
MNERKIEMVIKKYASFQEAEDADDLYWANTSIEERLNELNSLRRMVLSNDNGFYPEAIEKIVTRKNLKFQDD